MRQTLIAGNWKMNLDRTAAVQLAQDITSRVKSIHGIDVVVCPSFGYLDAVATVLQGSTVSLGAQNLYPESSGAFTGEVSASMLCDLHCRYVILGHSERRHVLDESNEFINRKMKIALANALSPILCVGELLADREAQRTDVVVQRQLLGSLADISAEQMRQVTIAYEPVWAIGTGEVATPEQAELVHLQIRQLINDHYGSPVSDAIRILYGGSVKPDNATELLQRSNIDGALVGGAALKADSFIGIIENSLL